MGSIFDPMTCGFAKGIIYELWSSNLELVKSENEAKALFSSRINQKRHALFSELFANNESFHVDYTKFIRKYSKIVNRIGQWAKRHTNERKQFVSTFNIKAWKDLTTSQQEHTLFDCKGCIEASELKLVMSTLSVKGIFYIFRNKIKSLNPQAQEFDSHLYSLTPPFIKVGGGF